MSFLSGLKVFGKDIVKAFAWFGSPKGKTVIATGEAVLEDIMPASAPIVDLFNSWAAKAYNVEALAVAAGKAQGSGPDKAVAVNEAILPDILTYAVQEGLSPRTADQITAANNAVIAFINAMTQPTP